jgi:hypothetical protein
MIIDYTRYKKADGIPFFSILLISELLLNQAFLLYIDKNLLGFNYFVWIIRGLICIISIKKITNLLRTDSYSIKLFYVLFAYFISSYMNVETFRDLFFGIIRSLYYSIVIILTVNILKEKFNDKKISLTLGLWLIVFGLIEFFFQIILERTACSYDCNIWAGTPGYVPLGLILINRYLRSKILTTIIISLIIIYIIDINRSLVVALIISMIISHDKLNFAKRRSIALSLIVITIIYTIMSAYTERNAEMIGSFNTGRGLIWWFWLENLLSGIGNLIFGFGFVGGMKFLNLSDYGNMINGTDWINQFHSAFIATIVNGGIIKLLLFMAALRLVFNNILLSTSSAIIFYYSLTMMSLNSMVSYFEPELNQYLFLIGIIGTSQIISDKNEQFISQKK